MGSEGQRMTQPLPLTRIILYVHDTSAVSMFYQTYFGFQEAAVDDADLIHLVSPSDFKPSLTFVSAIC
jgi:hypothetical protein